MLHCSSLLLLRAIFLDFEWFNNRFQEKKKRQYYENGSNGIRTPRRAFIGQIDFNDKPKEKRRKMLNG
ncbi:CLUMA_CG005609, isoform A [Clunio marinus]|uniref:CLUMA_CG005609, isoform A n=1 Tax=Clunio marinus TaxID=568069 RepID=A0A1J1HVI4_9DIPT|nr:CLUMA_CG005609, isoform A [Clunio marinus]